MQARGPWLLILLAANPVVAGEPGTAAATFLKFGAGPRAIAMGEAQAALADDVYAVYWNPAGLAQIKGSEAGFTFTRYIEDITHQFAGYAQPLPKGTLGASLTYLGVGRFQSYDANGQATGLVGANDTAVAISYGFPLQSKSLGPWAALGGSLKYIQERLDTVTAKAWAGDIGILLRPPVTRYAWLSRFQGGLSLRHLGSRLRFDQESFELPMTLTSGLSCTHPIGKDSLVATLDRHQPNDARPSWGAGAEWWVQQMIALRVGYTTQGDLGNGLRAGVGFRIRAVQLDYALANLNPFGFVHRVGLIIRFSADSADPIKKAQSHFESGLRRFRQRRFAEALLDFNKTLELDPGHPRALEWMKKAHEELKAHPAQ